MCVTLGVVLNVGHNVVGCWRLCLYVKKEKGPIGGNREVMFVCECVCLCV